MVKNKNGVQDDDEKGLAGVYVTLKDSNNRITTCNY